MKKRILYPGKITGKELILVSGSINSMYLTAAVLSLQQGIKSMGYSCVACTQNPSRYSTETDQNGDYSTFDLSNDVTLFNMGEYVERGNFREGDPPPIIYTRCVFFSPLANPSISYFHRPAWELEIIAETENLLTQEIGVQTHLAPENLLRPAASEQILLETANEVLYYLERSLPVPQELVALRKLLYEIEGLDQIPGLEKELW